MAACGDDADGSGGSGDDQEVTIGTLADITGATGDTGTPYSEGQDHFFEYLESTGGIDGLDITHLSEDYAYEISDAQRIYQQYRDRDGVSAILGWGTGDTEALRQQVASDQIPFMSASYSENLKDLDESPYNFFVAASYSDQGRMVLEWIKDNHEGGDPTVALLYNDTGFGRSPIDDIKDYAEEIGVEIVDEQIIDLAATDAQSQLLNMEEHDPDYGIIQQTWAATTTILRDADTLDIDTQFIGLNQAVGEGLIDQAGDLSEGFMGVLTHALPYEDVPGMDEYIEYLDSQDMTVDDINMQHVAGWVVAKVMVEGVKNAADSTDGEITGEDVLAGLEAIEDLDLGGLAAPVTFTDELHAGTEEIRLGIVEDGQWKAITDYDSYR
ncbi:ABC transporter substrate-binding protein [Alkalibacillus aidingensis]|uniref:ABC transporter substrate-binding protein n=1 Tax=Alkalibacillus aidingensis TaxID=2747607 RepID=UPI00166179D3|nr:ABC transporter substrate-binding protein [Alkalibacillus aidingensis]